MRSRLLAVLWRGRGRSPDGGEIGPEREQTVALGLRDYPWLLPFAALQFGLGGIERPQALLPFAFEAARHQPVVGVDGAVAAFGALRFVAGPLQPEPPLLQSGLAVAFEPFSGGECGGKPGRLQGEDEGAGDGLVDLNAADIEAIDAAALDQNLARTMVPRRRIATAIVGVQAAAAMAAAGEPLQEGAALPHGATRRSGPRVAGDPFPVGFIALPVDEARMMVRDQHLPLGTGQVSQALLAPAGGIQDRFLAGLAIGVGAGIDGVGEDMVDGSVACLDPADLAALVHLQREFVPFRAEPQPDAPGRAGLRKAREDSADGGDDGLVRMKTNLALRLTPHKADRQTAPELAPRSLVANAAIEARAQHMQFRLAHRALESEQQPVIEQRRVIEAIGIADQRVGEPGKVDQAIPFGIVARQTRDFETEHEADMGERHLGGQPGEAGAGDGAGAGKTEILIDDDHLFVGPAETRAPCQRARIAGRSIRDCARPERRSTGADRRWSDARDGSP